MRTVRRPTDALQLPICLQGALRLEVGDAKTKARTGAADASYVTKAGQCIALSGRLRAATAAASIDVEDRDSRRELTSRPPYELAGQGSVRTPDHLTG